MEFFSKNITRLLLCLLIAGPAWFAGLAFPVIGGPVIAIILGMIVTLFIKDKSAFQDGINYCSKKILQYAVILLGFGLNLSVILDTGRQSLPSSCAPSPPPLSSPLSSAGSCTFRERSPRSWGLAPLSAGAPPLRPLPRALTRTMRRWPRPSR